MHTKQPYTESELVDALKNFEEGAFRYLYMNYRGSLYTVILQIVPDPDTANDVLQEVFINVWKNISKYDPEKGRLYTWLFRLTRNMAINQTRSRNYKNSLKNENLENLVNHIDDQSAYYQNINLIGLRKQVSLLKEKLQTVLVQSYYEGFTHEEIAGNLNLPIGTVKTRLRAAVLELRKHFE